MFTLSECIYLTFASGEFIFLFVPQPRFKGIDVPATVEKNAPSFCAVYEISEGTLASVHSASSTVFKTGSPEDLRDHSSSSSDISNSNSPKTGPSRRTIIRLFLSLSSLT
jgi:hypothetical protein